MADIRIKDLTTTASSSASDDFIAIDGTTNGTRKLNAYSPSFGGNATVTGTLAVNGGDVSASRFAVAAPSNTITGNFTAGSTSNQSFGLRVYAGTSATDYALKIRNVADTLTLLNVDGVGTVSIGATTASTTTSTGALVCSGGVGVAKSINAGDIIEVNFSHAVAFRGTSTNSDCQLRLVNNSSGGREYHLSSSGTASGGGAGFHVWDGTDNVSALSIDASRNSTFGGSVKTSAPSGGTAAAWKLGTVASVSPTSPNRTIEVDIGGTIYYIHAKTTNN